MPPPWPRFPTPRHGDFRRPASFRVFNGPIRVVQLLLSGGADVDARGPGGKTPLHAAALGPGG
jgi:ankyrin repeat protein